MKDGRAAQRYARALEGATDSPEELGRVADELEAVVRAIAADRQVAAAIASPAIDVERKKTLIDSLAAAARLSGKTANLMKILAEHGRLDMLAEVASAVGKLRDNRLGIVEAEVTTAAPLTPDMVERTKKALEKKAGRSIRLTTRVDPSIVGGMVARIGSTVYDGSVKSRLSALRSALSGGR